MGTNFADVLASALRAKPARVGPVLTVNQFEERHPATKNRMRGWIMRADLNLPGFSELSDAVIRIGRSVMLDEAAVLAWLQAHKNQPKSRARNPHGCRGLKDATKRKVR